MKKLSVSLLFLLLVLAVAVAGACFSNVLCKNMRRSHQEAHDWIHSQLGVSAQQKTGLQAIEGDYHEKRALVETELRRANIELAQAIRSDEKDAQRVNAVVEKIHHKMGELQKLTLAHVFAMREILSPEQYQKLLNLTADALENIDSCRHGE